MLDLCEARHSRHRPWVIKEVFKVNRGKAAVRQDAAEIAPGESGKVENQAIFVLAIRVKPIMLLLEEAFTISPVHLAVGHDCADQVHRRDQCVLRGALQFKVSNRA
jgi:hypothetical protein